MFRRIKAKIRRQVQKFFALVRLLLLLGAITVVPFIPTWTFVAVIVIAAIGVVTWIWWFRYRVPKFEYNESDARNTVRTFKIGDPDYRRTARDVLRRELAPNEVVHHINGRREDNHVSNLCVMDRERHEHFHSWLQWKRKKSGFYPSIANQRRALQSEYEGILLDQVSNFGEKPKPSSRQMQIFNELRRERRQIASEEKLPLYLVVSNDTLMEISERMPKSEQEMLQVNGASEVKLRRYGPRFLAVLKRFRD